MIPNYKFSVSMCVYGKDNAEHFKQSLNSVISQTVLPNEIVLVVDGPISNDIQMVIDNIHKLYQNLNVIYLENNQGHGNARRIGLENCKYEFVAIMDSDDICVRNRFELQLNCFKKNELLSIVGGNISEFVDEPKNIVGNRNVPQTHIEIVSFMKKRCPLNQVTVMFKKSDVLDVGGYIDWYCEEDYYLWIRMYLKNKQFYNINATLVNVRVGKDMYKRRGGLDYFKSEAKLQKYMLNKGMLNHRQYCYNVLIRFILQILMPNSVRGIVFKIFARK